MPMTGKEVLTIRERLELSQQEFADLLGTSERTVRRWESGGCPELVARFLVTVAMRRKA